MLEAAINDEKEVPGFIRQFNPPFPVGWADRMVSMNFMQLSPMVRSYVPYLSFIDRKGVIRAQYTGADEFFTNQEQSFREELRKLLAENNGGAKPAKSKRK